METDYFNMVASVQQGDILALYLFVICLDNVFQMSIDLMKENGFILAKARSRRYPAQTVMDVDYVDNITLLANISAKADSLIYSLEWVAAGIGRHVNTDKSVHML